MFWVRKTARRPLIGGGGENSRYPLQSKKNVISRRPRENKRPSCLGSQKEKNWEKKKQKPGERRGGKARSDNQRNPQYFTKKIGSLRLSERRNDSVNGKSKRERKYFGRLEEEKKKCALTIDEPGSRNQKEKRLAVVS